MGALMSQKPLDPAHYLHLRGTLMGIILPYTLIICPIQGLSGSKQTIRPLWLLYQVQNRDTRHYRQLWCDKEWSPRADLAAKASGDVEALRTCLDLKAAG